MLKKIILFLIILCSLSLQARAGEIPPEREYFIEHNGRVQRVTYRLYMPAQDGDREQNSPVPVVVCIGGIPLDEHGDYVQSGSDECMEEPWFRFADENRVAVLGLGFLHVQEDWRGQQSYQFPKAWSGEALLEILEILEKECKIDSEQLYMTGVSAGAQFSIRFAQMKPEIVRGVAAHGAGGYDDPDSFIPVKFLITVGELDSGEVSRLEFAKIFTQMAKEKGIDIELRVIPGIGHTWSEAQREMSRGFFKKILNENKRGA